MSWLSRILGGSEEREGDRAPTGDPARIAQVREVIESVRPLLVADGGDIEIVAVEEGWVHVRMHGACSACHASPMTLRGVLEPRLRAACDWVEGVRAV